MGWLIMVVSSRTRPSIHYASSSIQSADWQQNLYGLNSNFGSDSDLRALASAIHARGMVSLKGSLCVHRLPSRSILWSTSLSIISAGLEATPALTTPSCHLSIANHRSTRIAQLPLTTTPQIRQESKMYDQIYCTS